MAGMDVVRGGGSPRASYLALLGWLLAAVALLACLASPAEAADRVYWANDQSPAPRISWANLDGSGGDDVRTTGASSGAPRGVTIDVVGGKLYWTNPDNDRISFANLDGSGAGDDLYTGGATVDRPNAAAVYPAVGRIYWANEIGDRISFANLDGSGGGDLKTAGATVDVPIGPAVDPRSGRIYWGNANPVNRISFANLDGSGGANINTGSATVDNPHGVAIDPVTSRIYWANIAGQEISWANLDGTGGGDLKTSGATVSSPIGVAIDPEQRKIYWANWAADEISWANLDGSGGGDLKTPGATRDGSRSPVLLKAPSGAGAPAITGGSGPGAVLTCSQGAWAPDLLGSLLYRVPQSFAYSWTLDGAAIAGATGAIHATAGPGEYRCTVTASNLAGATSQTSAPDVVSPPAFGARTLLTLRLAARKVPARGPLPVMVSNGNTFALTGKLSARTTRRVSVSRRQRLSIRSKSFAVGALAKKKVRLSLTKQLRRVLRRAGKLSLRLTATVVDPAGHTRATGRTVAPRLKKKTR
jgi:DNA-binding beta-propeller fold protein YncE